MSREYSTPDLVLATRLALLELAEVLQDYPRAVIVGGTVPYLLVPQEIEPHEGTVDIDIVLDLEQPGADEVYTLHEVLERRLFIQDPHKPFRYTKGMQVGDEAFPVLIELIAGGTPPPLGLRRIPTEDVFVCIIEGMEVALHRPVEVTVPFDSEVRVTVASLPALLSMKASALALREKTKKSKDAYDIVYCLRNYPGGLDAVAKECHDALAHPVIATGLGLLRNQFLHTDSVGPVAYAWVRKTSATLR